MTERNEIQSGWANFIPRSVSGWIALALIVVVAFALGAIMTGGGDNSVGETEVAHKHEDAKQSEPTIWTCSMHPQIQLPKPGKCPICFMDLIPLETGSHEDVGPRQLRMSEAAKMNARIMTTPARRAFAETEVRMVGKLAYDETKLAYITAWAPGRLDKLYADYTGITVNKGDHMVYMYSPELLASQEELLQAKHAVEALSGGSEILRETAAKTLSAARDKLRLYGLSDSQIAEIEKADTASDHLTINAPIGGVVVHKNALEGAYVKTGTKIYTIADMSQLWVMFEAYESDLPWLRYGQEVTFTSPSFPGEKFTAKISFIDPTLNDLTRTVNVRAVFDNSDNRLKPDMFVSGVVKSKLDSNGDVIDENLAGKWIGPMHPEVVKDAPGNCDICGMPLVSTESLGYAKSTEGAEKALIIPASAPLLTGSRAVVYVELPDAESPTFEGREVTLGPRAGDWYVVKSGLAEGELVVTNGAFKIDAELQIRAKPSMMSPDGGAPAPGHNHGAMKHEESERADTSAKSKFLSASSAALQALDTVYCSYFHIQEALAADDITGAANAFAALSQSVDMVDMTLFEGDSHMEWMKIANSIKESADKGAAGDELASARSAFLPVSEAIITLEKTFGHGGDKNYFLTFCPMANDNQGAFWLQTVDTVYNSFFGESMLRCGSIEDTLEPTSR